MSGNKLSAKAARLDFSRLPGSLDAAAAAAPAAPVAPAAEGRPKTAPGAMMAYATDARSELMRENEQLRQQAADAAESKGKLREALAELGQWEGAQAARLLDPTLIEQSRFANRHAANYSSPEFAALKAEIESAGGNVQPVKVRRIGVPGSATPKYELVFGHRRHRACLELGLPVLAVIDNLDDRTLFVEMDRENRARKDLSAWEQGTMYRNALNLGLFPSNRRLAEAVGVDLSALGKALALADLPPEVVDAFNSPLDLQFRWAKPLADALTHNRDKVLQASRALRQQDSAARAPKAVFEALVAAGSGQGVEPFHPPQKHTVDVDGSAAAELRLGSAGEVTVSIQPGWGAESRLAELSELIAQFLRQSAKGHARPRRAGRSKPKPG